MDRWMFRGSHRTVRYIRRRLTVRASSLQTSFLSCFVRNLEWNGSGREFSVCMEYMKRDDNDRFRSAQNAERRKNRVYPCRTEMGLSLQQRCRARILSDRRKKAEMVQFTVWEAGRHILCGNISCRWRNLPERIHRESARDHIRREQCGICVQI